MKNIFNKIFILTIFIISTVSLSSLKVNAMDATTQIAIANSNNQAMNSDDDSDKYTSLIFFIEKDGKPEFIENKKEEGNIRKKEIQNLGIKVRNKNKKETKGHDVFVKIGGEKMTASSWKIGNTPENQLEQKHNEMYEKLKKTEIKFFIIATLISLGIFFVGVVVLFVVTFLLAGVISYIHDRFF